MSKKAALHNLGCKVNAYETEAMQEMLEKAGYEIVPFKEGADVYVINTCTVTNIADRKSRQMLHRARKMNPDAVVVAAGCYVQAQEGKVDSCIDIVLGNNKKKDLIRILDEYRKSRAESGREKEILPDVELEDIGHTKEYESLNLTRPGDHTRAYIKVQDGCNQFCTYCIIPYARGRVRSRSMEDVTEEVRTLAENGYKEVVLTGIHLSSYGIDFDKEEIVLRKIVQIFLRNARGRVCRTGKDKFYHISFRDLLCGFLHLLIYRTVCRCPRDIDLHTVQLPRRKRNEFRFQFPCSRVQNDKALLPALIESASFQTTRVAIDSIPI